MEQIILAVFFIINGEPTLVDGWYPLSYSNRDDCVIGQTRVEQQLDFSGSNAVVFCGTQEEIQRELDILNSTAL